MAKTKSARRIKEKRRKRTKTERKRKTPERENLLRQLKKTAITPKMTLKSQKIKNARKTASLVRKRSAAVMTRIARETQMI